VQRAALPGITFHGLRHSFVAILVAAGCNVREVSEWARHDSVAFTLTRYGGLFEDGLDAGVDRLEALLGSGLAPPRCRIILRTHGSSFQFRSISAWSRAALAAGLRDLPAP
jgi:hypothetical protein